MKQMILIAVVLGMTFLMACTPAAAPTGAPQANEAGGVADTGPAPAEKPSGADAAPDKPSMEDEAALSAWLTTPLTDVRTGETYVISELGKPVILESFAVWCPTCTKQQRNIKTLHEDVGDSVVSIALDTDPNENAAKVKDHAERNGFDWHYSVSPIEVTQSLISDFGNGIVNAPSAPVLVICEDHSTKFLSRGVKSVDALKAALAQECGV